VTAWARDLALGARLVVSGGREGWIRTALTTVGVGLGVAMLLVAASVPAMLTARDDRMAARDDMPIGVGQPPRGDSTVLLRYNETIFRGHSVRGRIVQADGANPVLPPGLSRLPRPGELIVSPALADLLASPDGALLRPRLVGEVVGTIGNGGLSGPREYAFYRGSDELTADNATRLDRFGNDEPDEPLDPVLMLLVVVLVVVLLLPIGVLVAAAVRFGGERRDRRLAALRLVGADVGMTRRVAAGEAAVGALLGLFAGGVFFLAGRPLVELFSVQEISIFATDVRPNPVLAALIAAAVPVAALGVTLLAMRRVVVEPLGVVRRTGTGRRRVWWRFALPAVGLAALSPLIGDVTADGARFNVYLVAAGAVLVLVGVIALLPWLVEAVVRRLGGRGAVPWQMAVRRLQIDGGASARMVSGIAVAAAGGIALQMFFGAIDDNYRQATGQDPGRAHGMVWFLPGTGTSVAEVEARLAAAPGARSVIGVAELLAQDPAAVAADPASGFNSGIPLLVGRCAALREFAQLDRCADGDTFLAGEGFAQPGSRVVLLEGGADKTWTVPRAARAVQTRPDPVGGQRPTILITPGAAGGVPLAHARMSAYVTVDQDNRDAYEHLRNAAAGIDQHAFLSTLTATFETPRFASIRRALFAGVLLTLLLIGASLLVTMVEQLRERRRLLAVLVAFGARRGTLAWSVLWQTAVPVALGMVLAILVGLTLGVILLAMVDEAIRVNWPSITGISGAGAAVVLLVTVLSMPALWRMMRPDGLRTE
jgi:hypothetical protein